MGEILKGYGVPAYLINRIITAIFHERTSVRWNGSRTNTADRTKGVKQGCPISPYIFVVVLHYAIQRVCDRLRIDTSMVNLLLPLILAYADDIILLSDSLTSIEIILVELERELRSIGLTVNEKKCSIMLRDPVQVMPPIDGSVRLNGKDILVVSIMRYLGIYISSDLDRRSTVSHRIQLAYRSYYMFLPFLKANLIPFDTIMRLYHTVIIPTVLYGLKVATLTKRNRQSLRRMERYIVLQLRLYSRDPPTSLDIPTLLHGRTIIRKCRVQRLKYWGHINRRPAAHVLKKALLYYVPGKFKRGRPCYTWNDSLARDLRRTRNRN